MLVYLFYLLSHLPLRMLHWIGCAAGWLVYCGSPSYRRRLQLNLQRAGYSKLRKQAIVEAGKNILELAFIWCAPAPRVLKTARVEQWDVVQAALEKGKGIIFLTPHLGCFEIIAQTIASRMPLTALYRPPRKAALKPLIEGARARANLLLAPANLGGVRTLLKTLKNGGAIGLLPDQVPQNGEGVWADFFGRPAYTMTLPAKLHHMTNAPIILAYAERLPHGRGFLVRFVPFMDLDGVAPTFAESSPALIASPQQQARLLNRAMEQLIANCPAQYFWSYNRYKTPKGVTAPTDSTTSMSAVVDHDAAQ
jgi:KDO2-lipid IV(A) lauroyltransferase